MVHFVRKEIGSEFWSVPVTQEANHFFPAETQWFLSGRSALECLIAEIGKQHDFRSVAIPAWCCDSMVKPFLDAGIEVRFYPVYVENGRFVQDYSDLQECDALFLMDYFGYSGYSDAHNFQGIRIRDLTHSIFSGNYTDAHFYFGSLRKWAGFYTGGFGWGFDPMPLPNNNAYSALRREAMNRKESYITGKSDSKEYLTVFSKAEDLLEQCTPAQADERDVMQAAVLNVEQMRHRRRENAAHLLETFSDIAVFPELGQNDCPLFVPVLVPDGKRDALRRFLIDHEIYCPVHWPLTEYHSPDSQTMKIYRNELSLVCDQRYSREDMDRLIKTIRKFWGE